MKRFALILTMLTLLYGGGVYAQDPLISLDTTFGLTIDNTVVGGGTLTFIIRSTNLEDNSFNGISNGFRVYSPDGLTWTGTSANQLGSIDWTTNFMIFQTVLINVDGIGADTIGFGGIGSGIPPSIGIPALFDDTTYSITIGPIIATEPLQQICLDSSWYPPGNTWYWGGGGGVGNRTPAWDGPHCFLVVDTADSDDDGVPDVIDNCEYTYNPEQLDSDSDGLGDICDDCTDIDGDGFGDLGFANTCDDDNCPAAYNPTQSDADSDGSGDACDECTDTDGDGFGNPGFVANTCPEDNCPSNHNPNQSDSNGDGFGDACSLNEDYHGVYTIMNTATKEVWSQNIVWSFAGDSFAMWLNTTSELTHCFCAISGRYEATDRILLSVDAYQPDEGAGCTSCNDNENPDGLFDYAWLSNTLTLSQTTGGWERTLSLVSGCCQLRADIGHDGIVDISDLVWLVDYMFNGGAPPICMAEADVTGSGSELIDISDLVYLVDYMFSSGLPPVPCP